MERSGYSIRDLEFIVNKNCARNIRKIPDFETTLASTLMTNDVSDDVAVVTSSSGLVVLVTLIVCFVLLLAFCCFKRFSMKKKGKKLGNSPSKEAVTSRMGSYKRGTPIVFDGESTTTDRLSTPSPLLVTTSASKRRESGELACLFKPGRDDDLQAEVKGKRSQNNYQEISRPPPPPYLVKG